MFSGAFVTFLSDGVGSQGVGSGCGRDRILRCIGRTGYPVGPERQDFLYPNTSTGSSVELRPSVAFCFRKFHPLISDLVRGAWARYVRQQNLAVVGETTDLNKFLFGSERASLAAVRPVLLDIQQGRVAGTAPMTSPRRRHDDRRKPPRLLLFRRRPSSLPSR
jgi:hypothetical protein